MECSAPSNRNTRNAKLQQIPVEWNLLSRDCCVRRGLERSWAARPGEPDAGQATAARNREPTPIKAGVPVSPAIFGRRLEAGSPSVLLLAARI
jgi:hypothetical protein